MLQPSPAPKRNISAPQNILNIGEYPNIRSFAPSHTNRLREIKNPHKMLSCKGFRIKVEVPSGIRAEPFNELILKQFKKQNHSTATFTATFYYSQYILRSNMI